MGKIMSNKSIKLIALLLIIVFILGMIALFSYLGIYFYKEKDINVKVMGYYTGDLNSDQLDLINMSSYTHIFYAFAVPNMETGLPELSIEKSNALNNFMEYLTNKKLNIKVLLSIGGGGIPWPINDTNKNQMIPAFVNECKNLVELYKLDGIDVDWEFPTTQSDMNNFCQLMVELRNVLGEDKLLSYAATTNLAEVSKYDNKTLSKVCDFVNVMTYDFSLEKQAPINTVKTIMLNFFVTKGYKKSQINLGIPFYGRSASSRYEYSSYQSIMNKVEEGELKIVEKANYSYAESEYGKVTFDTVNIVKKKAKFVKEAGFGGIFTWHISCDRNNELLNAMCLVK